jgi:hypothetical protein
MEAVVVVDHERNVVPKFQVQCKYVAKPEDARLVPSAGKQTLVSAAMGVRGDGAKATELLWTVYPQAQDQGELLDELLP